MTNMSTTQTTPTTTRRFGAGSYDITSGSFTVHISRFDHLDRRGGQWVARAEFDRYCYSDPLFTLAEAKAFAIEAISEAHAAQRQRTEIETDITRPCADCGATWRPFGQPGSGEFVIEHTATCPKAAR